MIIRSGVRFVIRRMRRFLTSCWDAFSLGRFGGGSYKGWNLQHWLPTVDGDLAEWWSSLPMAGKPRCDAATVLVLVCWSLWKHRNRIVFDHIRPSVVQVLTDVIAEGKAWSQAGLLGVSLFSTLPISAVEWRDSG